LPGWDKYYQAGVAAGAGATVGIRLYADYQLGEPRTADLALEMLAQHCSMVRELGRYRAAARV